MESTNYRKAKEKEKKRKKTSYSQKGTGSNKAGKEPKRPGRRNRIMTGL